MGELAAHVHARNPETGRREVFGPGDELPGWFSDVVTNPKVYVSDESDEDEEGRGDPERPADSAKKDEWVEYAKAVGVDPTDMTKEQIQAATP